MVIICAIWFILKELKKHSVLGNIIKYRNKWIQNVRRIDGFRLLSAMMKYQPERKRKTERQLERPLDLCRPEWTTRPKSFNAWWCWWERLYYLSLVFVSLTQYMYVVLMILTIKRVQLQIDKLILSNTTNFIISINTCYILVFRSLLTILRH